MFQKSSERLDSDGRHVEHLPSLRLGLDGVVFGCVQHHFFERFVDLLQFYWIGILFQFRVERLGKRDMLFDDLEQVG